MNELKQFTDENSEQISYKDLAERVRDCVMFNNANEFMDDLECVNGSEYDLNENGEQEEDANMRDIYQMYIITEGGADYLKENTNEIVYYSEKANAYFWGITHWGTSWSGVFTTVLR